MGCGKKSKTKVGKIVALHQHSLKFRVSWVKIKAKVNADFTMLSEKFFDGKGVEPFRINSLKLV